MDIDQIINYLMPHYHDDNPLHFPVSLDEAKLIVDQHFELSCLAIKQDRGHYTFQTILCANKSCLERSENVFNSIKSIVKKFKLPVNGWKFIFHFKGDACDIKATNFALLSNSRNVGNGDIILWPLLMKNYSILNYVKYNSILHDEANKYLQKPDRTSWENKVTRFVFRGTNSGNPFSCIQYEWNKERGSRCDLLLEYLKLPGNLKAMVDIGFNKLYPNHKKLIRNYDNVDYLKTLFQKSLLPTKNINDLHNEVKLVIENLKPTIKKREFFKYKYIICPEGFDCASSLCWVLASNCLAIVPPFHYENIIINSQYLKPYIHFLPIKEDYSDLADIINWAINNDDKCQEIVKNSNDYMKHFLDENSMLLVQKTIIARLLA